MNARRWFRAVSQLILEVVCNEREAFMTKATYSEPYDPIVELVKINPVPSILFDMKALSVAVINQAALKLLGILRMK
jgi:hypothetical protein